MHNSIAHIRLHKKGQKVVYKVVERLEVITGQGMRGMREVVERLVLVITGQGV
jgi:hypothetical protein